MTSTFTPNLNLQCQAVGDNSNTWGTILNSNVFSLVDSALGGSFSISIAGSSDYTLSTANAINIEHILTGVITANIAYVFPASSGRIVNIVNNTTGAFTVTVKQSGGTGVVVPQGESMFVKLSANTTTAAALFTSLGNNPSIGIPVGTSNGTAVGVAGQIRLYNASNTNVTTLKSGTATSAWTMTLPIGPGTSNQVLVTDGAGNTTWQASGGLASINNNFILANLSGTSASPVGTSMTALLDAVLGTGVGGLAVRGTSTWSALTHGTSTSQYLQSGGTAAIPSWQTIGAGNIKKFTAFSVNGTWTAQANTTSYIVEGWGAGGGGDTGAAGGDSTFSSSIATLTAKGGLGGTSAVPVGGSASGGDLNFVGGGAGANANGFGGGGGNSPRGGGGGANTSLGTSVGGFPGGGGGVSNSSSRAGAAGGYFYKAYISTSVGTGTIVVGGAGTSSTNCNGAGGLITITEYT